MKAFEERGNEDGNDLDGIDLMNMVMSRDLVMLGSLACCSLWGTEVGDLTGRLDPTPGYLSIGFPGQGMLE